VDLQRKAIFAEAERDDDLIARSFVGLFRASRKIDERLAAYGQYDFLHDAFAGVDQRHIGEAGISYQAVDWAPHRLRLDAGLGYLYEASPDDHFDSATLSFGVAYRLAISSTGEFTNEPRFILTLVDLGATRFDQIAALSVALNSILSLKLTHTIRDSATPAPGFKSTDTIAGVSLVARVRRP
jgi:putative salt-induced outer membrane protein YdiY